MKELPNVTVAIVDTVNYGQAINAIQKTLKQIKPARTIFFTDINVPIPNVEVVQIPHIYSKKQYSEWMIKELGKYTVLCSINTSHILVIQGDGYVLDGEMWDDAYLDYDYGGAVWPETDGFSVGNGGFSIRSTDLHRILATDETILGIHPEDVGIARIYRDYLEKKHGIKFMPEELAHKFSFELCEPHDRTFGFHQIHHKPYVEPIVIKRSGALGDVIQVEPILEYFHRKGHPVYLDTQPGFYALFQHHYFPVKNYASFDKEVIRHRVINLDLAYESFPKMTHVQAYFEFAGIKDYKLRKPKLHYIIDDSNRIFKKYVVIHIDERETAHRNIYGVNWTRVRIELESLGYLVIQIGKNKSTPAGNYFNTVNEIMMKWLIAGAELFIGVDSGPSHIAVGLGIKSVIFFGSVDPSVIHVDLTKIAVLKSACPIQKDNCWHSAPSTRGQDCEVDTSMPPCTVIDTERVLEAIYAIR